MKIYKLTYKANGEIKETTCTEKSIEQFTRVLDVIDIKEIEKQKKNNHSIINQNEKLS